MKRSKRLYALLGVLVAACMATAVVMRMEEDKEQIKATGEIVLAVSPDDVQSLRWDYEETSLSFHKDEVWLYDEDETFPVDEETVHDMLELFESFGVSFIIEDVTDYGMYGLDDPVCTIEFAAGDQSYKMELGDFSSMDAERYVSIGDGNVYLAKVDPLETFDAVLSDLIDHDETLSYDQVTALSFTGAEDYTITWKEEDGEDVWSAERKSGTLPLDASRVERYIKNLSGVTLEDYVTYNAGADELAQYGLEEPELTITVDYTDQDGKYGTYTIALSRDAEELAAAKEAEAEGKEPEDVTAYARVGDSAIIYRISEYDCDNLMAAGYNDLRSRAVMSVDFEDVTKLDIRLDGTDYTLTAEDEGKNRVWKYGGEEVEIDELQDALESLRTEDAASFTDEKASGKEEIRLTLSDAEGELLKIVLCRYDGSDCLAVVDGKTFARIPRADVVDVVEAVNAIVLN